MKEKREIVYLKADRNSVCHDPKIKIQDVMSVQCADSAICAGIKNKTLYTFKKNDDQKKEGKKKVSLTFPLIFKFNIQIKQNPKFILVIYNMAK